jgi:hypothetical protein
MKNDVNVVLNSNMQKTAIAILIEYRITDEKGQDPDPDPPVSGTYPRIRIPMKMSRIRNTAQQLTSRFAPVKKRSSCRAGHLPRHLRDLPCGAHQCQCSRTPDRSQLVLFPLDIWGEPTQISDPDPSQYV